MRRRPITVSEPDCIQACRSSHAGRRAPARSCSPGALMTERRLAPLSALSTLTRRPTRADVRPPLAAAVPQATAAGPSRVIDNAVYSDGRRVATPVSPEESRDELSAGEDRLAWLG